MSDPFDDIFSDEEDEKEQQTVKEQQVPVQTVSKQTEAEKTTNEEDLDDFFSNTSEEEQKTTKLKEAAPEKEKENDLEEDLDEMLKTATKTKIPKSKKSKSILELTPDDFDYSDTVDSEKTVHTVYGHKGEGKTVFYMSYPGTQLILCFDRKAAPIKKYMYKSDPRLSVKDARRYYSKESAAMMLATATITWNYVNGLLDKAEEEIEARGESARPDWVVIDGSDIFLKIAEMVMRANHNLQPFQGISNRNIWKERRMYLDQLHNRCLDLCKKGVIYTMYVEYEELIEEGTTITKEDLPAWIDAVMAETDVTVRVFSKFNKAGNISYYARVMNSKREYLKSGVYAKIDGTEGYNKLLEASEAQK